MKTFFARTQVEGTDVPPHTLESGDYDVLRLFFEKVPEDISEKGMTFSTVGEAIDANEAMLAAENLRQWLLWYHPMEAPKLNVGIVTGSDFIKISRRMLEGMREILCTSAKFLGQER